MSVKMTKAYGITTPKFTADFVTLEATMRFFSERRAASKNVNKFCATLMKVAFRNCKLDDLSFFKEKGADISFRDTKTRVLFTSFLYRIVLILSSYY